MAKTTKHIPGSATGQFGDGLESPATLSSRPTDVDAERLISVLTEQLEQGALPSARETATLILKFDPDNPEVRDIRTFLDEQLATVTSGQVGEVCKVRAHQTWVNGVGFSPDGKRAISCSGGVFQRGRFTDGVDKSIVLWEVESGRKLCRLKGHKTAINCVAFSPDGRRFLTGSRGGSICLWDAAFLNVIRQFQRRGKPIWSVAFSPDSRLVLSGSAEDTAYLWNVRDGKCLRNFQGHTGGISSVAFSPDGQRALTGSFDRALRLWDMATGQTIRRFEGHMQAVLGVVFTADGKQAVSASLDKTLRMWNLESGRETARLVGHASGVHCLAFSPEGRFLVSGGADRVVRLWDVAAGKEVRRFQGHTGTIHSVAFHPNGRFALSGSRDRSARLWLLPSVLEAIETPPTIFNLVRAIEASKILNAEQLKELKEELQGKFTETRALGWHLIERGWVTSYQINQLILGRGEELTLGEYVVLDRLGEGGMGRVLKGRNPRDNATVALKVAHPQLLANPAESEQFWWESEALTRLSHPNVIQAYDSARNSNPPFFVMEYLEGTDLEKLVRRGGPLPAALAAEYIRQAALGLEHAREKNLVHRDIKPANLLRSNAAPQAQGTDEEPPPLIKVIDWGIADLRGPEAEKERGSPLPKDQVVGTPDYLAPEQAVTPETTDIRADIYSLGCALYMLLTGKPPFHGGGYAQKLVKHMQMEPTPVQLARPDLPDGLAAVVHKMLAKSPADRHQTPQEVAAALTPFSTSKGYRPKVEERRARVRYPCKLKASCRFLSRAGAGSWDAEVRDISRGGLSLQSPREARLGAVLAIVVSTGEEPGLTRFVRVVHAKPAPTEGQWLLGCAFAREFNADELAGLLKGKSATAGPPQAPQGRTKSGKTKPS